MSDSETDPRDRTLTEKGLDYQINLLRGKFKSGLSAWRRHYTQALTLITDSQNIRTIKEHRKLLTGSLEDLTDIFEKLRNLIEISQDDKFQEGEKFEQVELEYQNIIQRITDCIQRLESKRDEIGSCITNVTYRSVASKNSRKSNISRISDAAAKAAKLKAELKYIDVESHSKAELLKVQTMKKLEIAQAEFDALNMVCNQSDLDSRVPISVQDGMTDYFNENVEAHSRTDMHIGQNVVVSSSVGSLHVSDSSTTLPPPQAGAFTPVKSEPFTPLPSVVWSHVTPSLPLNPQASAFTPLQRSVSLNLPKAEPPQQSSSASAVLSKPEGTTSQSVCQKTNSQADNPATKNVELLDFAKSLAEQVNLSRLPTPEPGTFAGDPLIFPSWMCAFETLIERRNIPSQERIHYLKRYVAGSVKELIEGYLLLSSDDAYEEAKMALNKRYGDPFVIANAFRDKLENWPKIQVHDGTGLRKFADFLQQCLVAMRSIRSLSVLNDDRENRKLLPKLPAWLVTRWNRTVVQWKEEKSLFPPFEEFVKFVVKEARIACDPVTSLQSLKSVSDEPKPTRRVAKQHSGRSFFMKADENKSGNKSSESAKTVCVLCKKLHDVDTCELFLKKSLEDRKSFAKNEGLCFACLGKDHLSRQCRHRKKCKVCSKLHPTSLHGDTRNRDKSFADSAKPTGEIPSHSGASILSNVSECSKVSLVVPVLLSHSDNPHHEILVYAMLDTQSDTSFILESSVSALGLSGTDVKLSLSTMHEENRVIDSKKVKGLQVRGFNSQLKLHLPDVFTRNIMPANRSHIPTPELARSLSHLRCIADSLMPLQDCEIGLLIGYDCPNALTPREVIASSEGGPFAQRTDLGWGIIGVTDSYNIVDDQVDVIGVSHRILTCVVPETVVPQCADHKFKSVQFSFRTKVKEVVDPSRILKIMESDFVENSDVQPISREDKRFLDLMNEQIRVVDRKYEMPLPFKGSKPSLPDNRLMAEHRLSSLKKRLIHDSQYKSHYFTFMNNLIAMGYAERVSDKDIAEASGHKWYIPHHGVYHPRKPNKVRVVFDCSAKFRGDSLNDHLLSGPDLTNLLVGVLCRFRKESIAFTCDIEQMFYQFKVRPEDRDFLRFLWVNGENLQSSPVDYRMTVHLFGAKSSPGCANFGLKRVATDYQSMYGQDVLQFVHRDFYVDDGLKSVSSVKDAVSLINRTQEMLSRACIRLCKFVSNSAEVLENLKPEDCVRDHTKVELQGNVPIEKTLGVMWCVESDTFQFRITLSDRPLTRRGILSTVSSVYDPLGLIAPFVLRGKQILQAMCANHNDWDDPLPESLHMRWTRWRNDIQNLGDLKVDRCVKPSDFGNIQAVEMHHFADASSCGYGNCSYLRLIDCFGKVHCSLLMGKSRVVPLRPITIPRLELCAAVVSVRVSNLLSKELSYEGLKHYFWTDSTIVLGYITNEAKRFHVFVANRVGQIRQLSEPWQWSHVTTDQNPADIASRGVDVSELLRSVWFKGPDFLWEAGSCLSCSKPYTVPMDDPELKSVQTFSVQVNNQCSPMCSILERLAYFSDWTRAKVAVALVLRLRSKLRHRLVKRPQVAIPARVHSKLKFEKVSVQELQVAKSEIIKQVQAIAFERDLEILNSSGRDNSRDTTMLRGSSLYKLNPFLDADGVVRVGGRLRNLGSSDLTTPIVLPRKGHITYLVIKYCHERVQHQGRGFTVNEIRSNGYWVIGCGSAVSFFISKCVTCRRLRGSLQTQKMANLPHDRLESIAPFTYVGVDLFGPWIVKEGRKQMKRYGVIFTCLNCRAIHLETANSLDTSSFINALRRFVSIRGSIRQLRSDQGTNFVGAERELREAVLEMDEERISQYLLKQGCDYFGFKMNVPSASHMGGVWERQIRTVRSVLSSVLSQSSTQLDDEALRTFMCEVSAIVNCRPLTVENLNDPLSLSPLTPNQLLTMKSQVVLPPPGEFSRPDLFSRKRWRRVQYLINEFWYRWRREYLQCLQSRSKWQKPSRNLTVGDVVLVTDDNLPRNQWKLGRVLETVVDDDGLVRKVKLRVNNSSGYLERPIHKLVMICENE